MTLKQAVAEVESLLNPKDPSSPSTYFNESEREALKKLLEHARVVLRKNDRQTASRKSPYRV